MSTKNTLAYQLILSQLLTGEYAFGDPISVRELSEKSGISRQPIMTALYRLQEQGFVDITAQVGCKVVNPSANEIQDFYEMFAAIEGVLAKLATLRATPEKLQTLKTIHHQIAALDSSSPDIQHQYRLLNISFHKALHDLADSPLVSRQQQANFDLSDFYLLQTHSFKHNMQFVNDDHLAIIHAIETQNADLAAQLAQAHILAVAAAIKSQ